MSKKEIKNSPKIISGAFIAKTEKQYLIIKSNPELVVLRKYSQKFVCATFDRENKKVKNQFYLKIIDQIAEEGFQIKQEKIGPLQLSKKK